MGNVRVKKSEPKDKTSMYADICDRVRHARMEHNMTQDELAKMVNMSQSAIGAIEQGLYTPNFNVLRVLKRRMNVSYDWLIDGEKATPRLNTEELERLREENRMLRAVVAKLTQ